jgi:catechol 2,3-dioxygenase
MTKIRKLGHVVLFVRDPMKSADWYCDLLGMEALVRDDRIPAAFLSFGQRDHDLALFRVPDDRELGHHDVEHVSFEIDGDIDLSFRASETRVFSSFIFDNHLKF